MKTLEDFTGNPRVFDTPEEEEKKTQQGAEYNNEGNQEQGQSQQSSENLSMFEQATQKFQEFSDTVSSDIENIPEAVSEGYGSLWHAADAAIQDYAYSNEPENEEAQEFVSSLYKRAKIEGQEARNAMNKLSTGGQIVAGAAISAPEIVTALNPLTRPISMSIGAAHTAASLAEGAVEDDKAFSDVDMIAPGILEQAVTSRFNFVKPAMKGFSKIGAEVGEDALSGMTSYGIEQAALDREVKGEELLGSGFTGTVAGQGMRRGVDAGVKTTELAKNLNKKQLAIREKMWKNPQEVKNIPFTNLSNEEAGIIGNSFQEHHKKQGEIDQIIDELIEKRRNNENMTDHEFTQNEILIQHYIRDKMEMQDEQGYTEALFDVIADSQEFFTPNMARFQIPIGKDANGKTVYKHAYEILGMTEKEVDDVSRRIHKADPESTFDFGFGEFNKDKLKERTKEGVKKLEQGISRGVTSLQGRMLSLSTNLEIEPVQQEFFKTVADKLGQLNSEILRNSNAGADSTALVRGSIENIMLDFANVNSKTKDTLFSGLDTDLNNLFSKGQQLAILHEMESAAGIASQGKSDMGRTQASRSFDRRLEDPYTSPKRRLTSGIIGMVTKPYRRKKAKEAVAKGQAIVDQARARQAEAKRIYDEAQANGDVEGMAKAAAMQSELDGLVVTPPSSTSSQDLSGADTARASVKNAAEGDAAQAEIDKAAAEEKVAAEEAAATETVVEPEMTSDPSGMAPKIDTEPEPTVAPEPEVSPRESELQAEIDALKEQLMAAQEIPDPITSEPLPPVEMDPNKSFEEQESDLLDQESNREELQAQLDAEAVEKRRKAAEDMAKGITPEPEPDPVNAEAEDFSSKINDFDQWLQEKGKSLDTATSADYENFLGTKKTTEEKPTPKDSEPKLMAKKISKEKLKETLDDLPADPEPEVKEKVNKIKDLAKRLNKVEEEVADTKAEVESATEKLEEETDVSVVVDEDLPSKKKELSGLAKKIDKGNDKVVELEKEASKLEEEITELKKDPDLSLTKKPKQPDPDPEPEEAVDTEDVKVEDPEVEDIVDEDTVDFTKPKDPKQPDPEPSPEAEEPKTDDTSQEDVSPEAPEEPVETPKTTEVPLGTKSPKPAQKASEGPKKTFDQPFMRKADIKRRKALDAKRLEKEAIAKEEAAIKAAKKQKAADNKAKGAAAAKAAADAAKAAADAVKEKAAKAEAERVHKLQKELVDEINSIHEDVVDIPDVRRKIDVEVKAKGIDLENLKQGDAEKIISITKRHVTKKRNDLKKESDALKRQNAADDKAAAKVKKEQADRDAKIVEARIKANAEADKLKAQIDANYADSLVKWNMMKQANADKKDLADRKAAIEAELKKQEQELEDKKLKDADAIAKQKKEADKQTRKEQDKWVSGLFDQFGMVLFDSTIGKQFNNAVARHINSMDKRAKRDSETPFSDAELNGIKLEAEKIALKELRSLQSKTKDELTDAEKEAAIAAEAAKNAKDTAAETRANELATKSANALAQYAKAMEDISVSIKGIEESQSTRSKLEAENLKKASELDKQIEDINDRISDLDSKEGIALAFTGLRSDYEKLLESQGIADEATIKELGSELVSGRETFPKAKEIESIMNGAKEAATKRMDQKAKEFAESEESKKAIQELTNKVDELVANGNTEGFGTVVEGIVKSIANIQDNMITSKQLDKMISAISKGAKKGAFSSKDPEVKQSFKEASDFIKLLDKVKQNKEKYPDHPELWISTGMNEAARDADYQLGRMELRAAAYDDTRVRKIFFNDVTMAKYQKIIDEGGILNFEDPRAKEYREYKEAKEAAEAEARDERNDERREDDETDEEGPDDDGPDGDGGGNNGGTSSPKPNPGSGSAAEKAAESAQAVVDSIDTPKADAEFDSLPKGDKTAAGKIKSYNQEITDLYRDIEKTEESPRSYVGGKFTSGEMTSTAKKKTQTMQNKINRKEGAIEKIIAERYTKPQFREYAERQGWYDGYSPEDLADIGITPEMEAEVEAQKNPVKEIDDYSSFKEDFEQRDDVKMLRNLSSKINIHNDEWSELVPSLQSMFNPSTVASFIDVPQVKSIHPRTGQEMMIDDPSARTFGIKSKAINNAIEDLELEALNETRDNLSRQAYSKGETIKGDQIVKAFQPPKVNKAAEKRAKQAVEDKLTSDAARKIDSILENKGISKDSTEGKRYHVLNNTKKGQKFLDKVSDQRSITKSDRGLLEEIGLEGLLDYEEIKHDTNSSYKDRVLNTPVEIGELTIEGYKQAGMDYLSGDASEDRFWSSYPDTSGTDHDGTLGGVFYDLFYDYDLRDDMSYIDVEDLKPVENVDVTPPESKSVIKGALSPDSLKYEPKLNSKGNLIKSKQASSVEGISDDKASPVDLEGNIAYQKRKTLDEEESNALNYKYSDQMTTSVVDTGKAGETYDGSTLYTSVDGRAEIFRQAGYQVDDVEFAVFIDGKFESITYSLSEAKDKVNKKLLNK